MRIAGVMGLAAQGPRQARRKERPRYSKVGFQARRLKAQGPNQKLAGVSGLAPGEFHQCFAAQIADTPLHDVFGNFALKRGEWKIEAIVLRYVGERLLVGADAGAIFCISVGERIVDTRIIARRGVRFSQFADVDVAVAFLEEVAGEIDCVHPDVVDDNDPARFQQPMGLVGVAEDAVEFMIAIDVDRVEEASLIP